jgi:hypothetical protein
MKFKGILFVLALILYTVFLFGVDKDSFLFIHDEFLVLNKQESTNLFSVLNLMDLGTANTTVLIVTIVSRIYYYLAFQLGLNLYQTQHLLYFLKLLLALYLPYFGFIKLREIFDEDKGISDISIFLVSLWYTFNSYSLIFWHGNSFSATLLLCYSLAPLTFYYFHKCIFTKSDQKTFVITAILLFLMSFAFYLFAVFFLLLLIYTFLYMLFRKDWLQILKRGLVLSVLLVPLFSINFLIVYESFFSVVQTRNLEGGETYGLLQGGLVYPLLMWFSWGIYTYWTPRNIFTFHKHFKSFIYILSPFVIYTFILLPGLKKKFSKKVSILFFVFLSFLFLVKGAQKPFGGLFVSLMRNFAPFRLFRSPDNKFGFGIIFTISLLLLSSFKENTKKVFRYLLLFVILVQGFPLFTGIAIRGENTRESTDRIISIPNHTKELVQYLEENSTPFGYLIAFPPTEFGSYYLDNEDIHLGQDLLPKLSKTPFVYLSPHTGMHADTYNQLSSALENNRFQYISNFPIKYYLFRKDTLYIKYDTTIRKLISSNFPLVFENEFYYVYENKSHVPYIQSENITYKIVNPTKYEVKFENVSQNQPLVLNSSHDPDFKLFLKPKGSGEVCRREEKTNVVGVKECIYLNKPPSLTDVRYLFQNSIFDETHALHNGYANSWTVAPQFILNNFDEDFYSVNEDGSINFTLTVFLRTQSVFLAGALSSSVYLFVLIVYLLVLKIRPEKAKSA